MVPVLTLAFYALDSKLRGQGALDPAKAFTSVAIISLVAWPANNLLAFFPQAGSMIGIACRIQGYLLEPVREDTRILIESSPGIVETGDRHAGEQDDPSGSHQTRQSIVFDSVSLRPAASAGICLEDISVKMVQGSLNVICGAVGTGKTTLARAILGDVPPEKGTIGISSRRIGYCAQKPWLINASIKSIVCGPTLDHDIDEDWYQTVIDACDLVEDMKHFSNSGSDTVGSRGTTLSGGQRQRVVR